MMIAEIASESESACEIGCFCGRTTKLISLLCGGKICAVDHFDSIDPERGTNWFHWFPLENSPEEFDMEGWITYPYPPAPGEVRKETTYRDVFEANMAEEIASGKLRVMPMKSFEAAPILQAEGAKFDLVFIDGDHSYEGVSRDIEMFLPLVNKGGVIGGHDYYPEAIGHYIENRDPQVCIRVREVFGEENIIQAGISWFVRV